MVLVYSTLSTLVTGAMGSGFGFERAFTNFETGAKDQWACIFQGVLCLGFGFLLTKLFGVIPSIVLEAILMGIEIKTVRLKEMIYTFKNDKKLFLTNISVTIWMLFAMNSNNGLFIGLFIYLVLFSKELMMPVGEIVVTKQSSEGSFAGEKLMNSRKGFFVKGIFS